MVKPFTKIMPQASTLAAVARAAGLSPATVSYALRASPKIPAATREHVRAVAARLGYRPNARVAELMSHIRGGRSPASSEVVALVWLEGRASGMSPFQRLVQAGAAERAKARGCRLTAFWLPAHGSPARLAQVLRARGITGVVFGPVHTATPVALNWPWNDFAMAVVGMAEWTQPLSRSGHHHYEAMRLAISQLHETGARRPAAWLDAATNLRAHRAWQAAWLACAPPGSARRLHLAAPGDETSFASWLTTHRPDALVLSSHAGLHLARRAGWIGDAARSVLLSWEAGHAAVGIEQGYDTIAAHAVDLVIAQLQRNERGLPEPPRMLLFPARWRSD